jgi:hypothetical protein
MDIHPRVYEICIENESILKTGKMEVLKLKINLESPADVCYLKVPKH